MIGQTPETVPLVTPYWRVALLGAFVATVVAYQGQRMLNAAVLARYGRGTIISSPLSHIGVARVGPLVLSYGIASSVVWAVGVAAMLVAFAICLYELAMLWSHPFPLRARVLAFAVTGLCGYYCAAWLFQAIMLVLTYQLAVLPPP